MEAVGRWRDSQRMRCRREWAEANEETGAVEAEEMDAAALTAMLNKKKVPELKAELQLAGLEDGGKGSRLSLRVSSRT